MYDGQPRADLLVFPDFRILTQSYIRLIVTPNRPAAILAVICLLVTLFAISSFTSPGTVIPLNF
jgi:hypothetical protein